MVVIIDLVKNRLIIEINKIVFDIMVICFLDWDCDCFDIEFGL